ncbi:MAG: hypothetical protein AB7I18_07305 [Candidatus Berkiella sp.]
MLSMNGLNFLIHRVDERILKHLTEDLKIEVKTTPEDALANHLKLLSTQVAQPQFSAAFNQAVQGMAKLQLAPVKLDDTPLHFGKTWKELMELPYSQFADVIKNSLKEKSITFNKLLVLARFKRQLRDICINGEIELNRREQEWQAKGFRPLVERSVDEECVQKMKTSAQEAQGLASIAIENGKLEGKVPFFGKSYEVNLNGPGRTEVTIMACEQAFEKLFIYFNEQHQKRCQESMAREAAQRAAYGPSREDGAQLAVAAADAGKGAKGKKGASDKRDPDRDAKGSPTQDPKTMLDLFPSTLKRNHVLTAINHLLAGDLIERLFLEEEFKAYHHFRLTLPSRLKSFPEVDGQQTRQFVCEELARIDDALNGKNEEEPDYWKGLLEETHDLQRRLAKHQFSPQLFLFKNTVSSASASSSTGKEIWARFHDVVTMKAQATSPAAVLEHQQGCRL